MRRRRRITGFVDERAWEWRELHDPDGPPTWRQLLALHRAGALLLVEPGSADRITKGEAAAVIDDAIVAGMIRRGQVDPPAERYARTCRAVVAHARAHPGCSTSDVIRALGGGRAYTAERVGDLLDLGVLVDRAAQQGHGRARELWLSDAAEGGRKGDE